MSKSRRLIFNLIAVAIISLPLLVIFFFESWMPSRAIVSFLSLINKTKSSLLFYMGEEYKAPYLLEEIWNIPGSTHIISEINFSKFGKFLSDYFKITFSFQNFLYWLLKTSDGLVAFSRFLMILACVILLFYVFFQLYYDESNLDFTHESKPLKLYKRFRDGPLKRLQSFTLEFLKWFRNSIYFPIIITIVVFQFGIPFIVIDLISQYFYFFTSFDFISILDTLLAEIITLYQGIAFLPFWFKLIIYYVIIRILTLWRARRLIEGKLIPKDEKMVNNDTGVFTLILGKMRGGKTTLATSMARIMNTIYHKNAYENGRTDCAKLG